MLESVGMTEKSLPVWQLVQVAVLAVGMWLDGSSIPSKCSVLAWQVPQSPLPG